MNWPTSQDYNEAIQNASTCFKDPALKAGQAAVNAIGLPAPRSGTFADVYQIHGGDGKIWAVKCFTRKVPGLQHRYGRIDHHLSRIRLPFTVGFNYFEEGIRVRSDWFPVLKMEWIEGFTLNEFVRDNIEMPHYLHALLRMWAKLSARLREGRIAHADLQHGNVLLVPGGSPNKLGLKLIDYDGMWVPALTNLHSGEVGHPNYQHPLRLKDRIYNSDVDRFSHLVIGSALRAVLLGGTDLWRRYDNGDNLLFTERDLGNPEESELIDTLWNMNDHVLRGLLGRLILASKGPLESSPWLDQIMLGDDGLRLSAVEDAQVRAILGGASAADLELAPEEFGDFEVVDDHEDNPPAKVVASRPKQPARAKVDAKRKQPSSDVDIPWSPTYVSPSTTRSIAPAIIGTVVAAVVLIGIVIAVTTGGKKPEPTQPEVVSRPNVNLKANFPRPDREAKVGRPADKDIAAESPTVPPDPPEAALNQPPIERGPDRDPIVPRRPRAPERPKVPVVRGKDRPLVPNFNELPDAGVLRSLPSDVKLSKIGETVYLSDLNEFGRKLGPFFGKNGSLGASTESVVIDKETPKHALSMPPPLRGYTQVCYSLGKSAKSLEGAVAISEHAPTLPPNPIRFAVLGDGRLLWRSNSMKEHGVKEDFSIDVSEISILELRVYAEQGTNIGSFAVWVDPHVTVQASNRPPPIAANNFEKRDPSVLQPMPADDKLSITGATVYLGDMSEFGFKGALKGWKFAKDRTIGDTANPEKKILVKGITPDHPLAMHTPIGEYTRICYSLGRRSAVFNGAVAISETAPAKTILPSTHFAILGDGKLLWRSRALRAVRSVEEFSVDVGDVSILELRVYVEPKSNLGSDAVWVDPLVKVKDAEALAKNELEEDMGLRIVEAWNKKGPISPGTLVFSADGEKLLNAAAGSPQLRSFQSKDGAPLDTVEIKGAQSIATYRNDLAVVIDAGQKPSIWNLNNKLKVFDFNGWQGTLPRFGVGLSSNSAVIADRAGRVAVWNVGDQALVKGYQIPIAAPNRPQFVSCSSQGDFIVVLTANKDVYSLTPRSIIFRSIGVTTRLAPVDVSPDGKTFIHAATESAITVFDTATGKQLRSFTRHTGPVKVCAFIPPGLCAVSAGEDNVLRAWDTETCKQFAEVKLAGTPQGLAVSPDGRFAATATTKEDALQVWNLPARPDGPAADDAGRKKEIERP